MSVLSDNVAIITGASSGIGWATAIELAKHNVKVVCAARRKDRLGQIEKDIVANGGRAIGVHCDVTKREDVFNMVEKARSTFGPIDILINNAGVMPLSFMDRTQVDEWEKTIDVNIKGVLFGVAACLPEMIERKAGHIVNVSSIAGKRLFPGGAVYCASKFAVHALSEGLRSELSEHNIRVTCIAPGWVETELQDHVTDERILERWSASKAESQIKPLDSIDIANAILYALQSPPVVGVNEVVIRPTRQMM